MRIRIHYYGVDKRYSFTLGVVGVDAGNAVTPSTGPHFPPTCKCSATGYITMAAFLTVFELPGAKNAKPEVVWSRDLLGNGTSR